MCIRDRAWSQLRSSGRKSAACADELIEFGEKRKWRSRLLEVAQECARRIEHDWQAYANAYDAGEIAAALAQQGA